MAIMQSCCCWHSVRRGSFACALYTGIYYSLAALVTGTFLSTESEYLSGNRSLPESASFLEPETISPTTVRFHVTLLACSCCGVVCSLLLLYGLCKDQRLFLVPWILAVITSTTVDMAHFMYLIITDGLRFNPITAMVYTVNFFLICLNVYSLLCVISQYQEYLAGRGTAADDCEYRVPVVRYAVPTTTTATSCLSSRRTPTNNETKTTATPTRSPTIAQQNLLAPDRSPTTGRHPRKHVQFPDTPSIHQAEKSEIQSTAIVSTETCKAENVKMANQPDNPATTVTIGQPTLFEQNGNNSRNQRI